MADTTSNEPPHSGAGARLEGPVDPGEFLRRQPPFDRLSDAAFRHVEASLEIVFAARGERVLERGGPPNEHLFVIRKGSMRLMADGRVIELLEEGECFGFPSLMAQTSATSSVIADEESLLLRIPKATFDQLMSEPEFAGFFVEGLNERLRQAVNIETPTFATDLTTPASSLIFGPPVFVPVDATVASAARTMSANSISSVLVDSNPPGIITDRDLRNRVLARGLTPDLPVTRAMSRPMHTLEASAPLFEMLVFMLERRVHHIPLVEGGEILGVVTDTDILRHHLKSPFHLLKEIERSEDPAALIGYGNRLTALVEALFGSGLDPTQIGRLVATLNDAVVVRVIRRAEAELGPPPMPYAWIVFGSEGRREQALLTDQDNALVYAEASEQAEAYFGELSQRVVSGLVEASFPPCPGGFMATNWHKPLAEWERMFRGWIEEPEPEALLDAANFFDYRAVHGGLPLDTLDRILTEAGGNSLFLAQLARAGLRFRPPLGLFRQLKDEDGGIEVKKGGIMPIVSLARVYGLQADASLRSTLLRLSGAGEADLISDEDAEMLSDAFRFLFRIRLEHQLRTVRSGGSPTNRVPLEHLTAMERRHLKETFQLVRRSQDALAQRFDVDMLG